MINDDDKNFDKNFDKTLNRLMIGGATLVGFSILAGTYDAGYQAGAKETKPITIHGNLTINNNSNNFNQPSPVEK